MLTTLACLLVIDWTFNGTPILWPKLVILTILVFLINT